MRCSVSAWSSSGTAASWKKVYGICAGARMDDEMLKNKAQLTRGDTAVLKNLHTGRMQSLC